MTTRIELFGCPMDTATMAQTVACIADRIERHQFTQQASINVAKLVHMQSDAQLARCVLASGAVMAGEDFTVNNAAFFKQFPYYVEPGDMNLDRIAANEIPRLVAQAG